MTSKRLSSTVIILMTSLATVCAQTTEPAKMQLFNHLDLGISAGTTGLGLEVAMPVGDYVKVRSGLSYVPKVEVPMTFGIQVGNNPETSKSKFDRMAGLLSSFTGYEVDDRIDMIGEPTMWNWHLLVDVYPLKNNRHWKVTAGFYLGPSHIAKAYNTTEDMPSLMAVGIYNNMYDKLVGVSRRDLPKVKLIDFSVLGEEYAELGSDPEMMLALQQKFENSGRMGVHVGDYVRDIYDEEGNLLHKEGDPYIMEPDNESMVKANMVVNRFKPFIGVGYEGRLSKSDDRYKIAVDCGVMFWGGAPSVTTHEGVDLNYDVRDIGGKVGRYVETINKFKVFPVINVRLTRRIF